MSEYRVNRGIVMAVMAAVLPGLAVLSPATAADNTVYTYISLLPGSDDSARRLVQKHSGQVLAQYEIDESLIGEPGGSRLIVAQWPEAGAAFRFLGDPDLSSMGQIAQISMGQPYQVSPDNTPTGNFSGHIGDRYVIGAFALSPEGTFRQCRIQMKRMLFLAAKNGGELVASYRVTSVMRGNLDPVLFGVLRFRDDGHYNDFRRQLLTRSLADYLHGRAAHGLKPGEALMLMGRAARADP